MYQKIEHYSFDDRFKSMTYEQFKEHFAGIYRSEFLDQAAREMGLDGAPQGEAPAAPLRERKVRKKRKE